jgi:ubiquinone/menaquinone biosynthesis C-methylase UbiE
MSENSDRFNVAHRKIIRERELAHIVSLLPAGAHVLEIGAGAGWQARRLSERGFSVTAIDIQQSRYHAIQEWPVIDYDGRRIPLPDRSVDVIFSSNVLEHVPHIHEFMHEMRRVLAPGGSAIHIMPTTLWRLLTSAFFYPYRIKALFVGGSSKDSSISSEESKPQRSIWKKLRNGIFPTRHGERGTVLTELYYFSSYFWCSAFSRGGWKVSRMFGTGLLYSGYRVFGAAISIAARERLAGILGSSCRVYVVQPVTEHSRTSQNGE